MKTIKNKIYKKRLTKNNKIKTNKYRNNKLNGGYNNYSNYNDSINYNDNDPSIIIQKLFYRRRNKYPLNKNLLMKSNY